MISYTLRPNFSFAQRQELLRSLGRSLELSRMYGASKGYRSRQRRMADNLRNAIKALATDLTDNPSSFGEKEQAVRLEDL
jgi:hypothetical protein